MKIKFTSIVILACVLSLFISCENFMNGASLKQNITDAIDYSNAEEYVIRFSSENGKISPSETKKYKNTDYISLRFTADSDYCFIRWTIINPETNKPYSDAQIKDMVDFFGKIDDPEPEVQLLQAVNNMEFKAVTAKRPKVVSNSPVYDNGGVYRDRTVSIMFDKPIDESSIYWTYDEISKIVSEAKYTYLECLNEKGEKVYYGYVSKTDEDDVTFKNITICDLRDQSINLLKYFEAPAFDITNRKTLRISTKLIKQGDELVSYAPKAATEILVTINPEVHFTYEEKSVGLPSEFSWVYLTNNKTDNEPPEFTAEFFITSAAEAQKDYDENRASLVDDIAATEANLQKYNIDTDKMWLKIGVLDGGSGPGKVEAVITKLNDKYYPESSTDKIETVVLDPTIAGSSGLVNHELDISSFEEGFYEIQIVAYDKNDRTVTSDKYYFYHDVVAPEIDSDFENTFTDVRSVFDKNQLTWKSQFGHDMAKCILTTEDITEEEKLNGDTRDETKSVEISVDAYGSNTTANTVSSLKNQHKYKNTLQFFDYAGNGTKIYEFPVDNTAPDVASVQITDKRPAADKNLLSWAPINIVDIAKCIVTTEDVTEEEKLNGATLTATITTDIECTKGMKITDKPVTGLVTQHKYQHTAVFYDYAGNASTPVVVALDNTAPNKPSSLSETRNVAESSTTKWTDPTVLDFAYTEITCKKADGTVIETDLLTTGTKLFTGLEDQTRYVYEAVAYDYSGNASEVRTCTDLEAPVISGLKEIRNAKTSATAKWTEPSVNDFSYTVITCKKADGTVIATDKVTTGTKLFTELEDQTRYVYEAVAYDFSGNPSNALSFTDKVAPVIGSLKESRTEKTSATASWNNSDNDGSYTVVTCKKADGTLVKTSEVKGTSVVFSSLENQTRYVYEAVAYDYSGNASKTLSFTDTDAPVIGALKETRVAATSATASWTNTDTVGAYTVVTCKKADGTLFKTVETKNTSYEFTGLTNETRYVYNAIVYDYSGNKSSELTFTDTTPPAKPADVYSGGRNGIVEFWLNTPNDSDYSSTKVFIGSSSSAAATFTSSKNTHDRRTVSGTNGTASNYYIYSYDFSGNRSAAVTINEKAGVNIGMIVYKSDKGELFCSKNYYNKNPLGVICKNDNLSKVFIWDLCEWTGYKWAGSGQPCSDTGCGGRKKRWVIEADSSSDFSNTVSTGNWKEKETNLATGLEWLADINGRSSFVKSLSIWNFIDSKDTKGGSVQWFIPSIWELEYILDNYDTMLPAYNLLRNAGYDAVLATTGQPYWTATPRYWNQYAYVGMFYSRTKSGCDWIVKINDSSTLKRLYCPSDEREGWYYKSDTHDTTDGKQLRMITHAMGQVNLQ